MASKSIAIAIDGPAAAGKSTVAKKIANHLSYLYIDTGAMYRALTYKAINENVDFEDEQALYSLLQSISIDLRQTDDGQEVFVNDAKVTNEIRTQTVTNNVSAVAKHPSVRKEMVNRQQDLANKRGVVMDGRDIGTHVIPDAEVKIFLIASVKERAQRRHEENVDKGIPSDLQQLTAEIEKRDQLDSQRATAPLIKAEDAIEIDTTSLSIDDVVDKILQIVHKKVS
ncbi:(d)CMP kinase [Aquibacillus sediminis]|uniref:(d)CMP kinase n=1 Tax=Aquibacillus sediminis TaxID=2574734 RepID=UPI001109E60E|nr:(d)CMP kinase [Aquibacillus sediminis]